VIDDEDIDRAFGRFQLEPELLLQRGEYGRHGRICSAGSRAGTGRSRLLKPIRRKLDVEIEPSSEPSTVLNDMAHTLRQMARQACHRHARSNEATGAHSKVAARWRTIGVRACWDCIGRRRAIRVRRPQLGPELSVGPQERQRVDRLIPCFGVHRQLESVCEQWFAGGSPSAFAATSKRSASSQLGAPSS
jgi:hypothetical protein